MIGSALVDSGGIYQLVVGALNAKLLLIGLELIPLADTGLAQG